MPKQGRDETVCITLFVIYFSRLFFIVKGKQQILFKCPGSLIYSESFGNNRGSWPNEDSSKDGSNSHQYGMISEVMKMEDKNSIMEYDYRRSK